MSFDPIKIEKIRALNEDVIVYDMYFGEQTTKSGIVLTSDDGQSRGIYPRWAKVYKTGPKQLDVKEGQWILIEHGRWTRKLKIDDGESIKEIQKVDLKGILAVADEKPNDLQMGKEFSNGDSINIRPEDFM